MKKKNNWTRGCCNKTERRSRDGRDIKSILKTEANRNEVRDFLTHGLRGKMVMDNETLVSE